MPGNLQSPTYSAVPRGLCFFIIQYASLFFIVGVGADSDDENELGVLEFIHCLVETLDKVTLQSPELVGRQKG